MRREFIPGLLLLLATAFCLWLIMELNREQTIQPDTSRYPEIIAEVIYATRMDANGHVKDQFYSPKMKHYSQNKVTEFEKPHIITYDTEKRTAPWIITAQHGRAYEGTKKIDLWGNVKVDQASTHITSDTLIVQTIEGRANEITAVGSVSHPATYRTVPSPGKPELNSQATTIKYYPHEHRVLFLGNAQVKQQNDKFNGPQMEYDTLRQIVTTPHSNIARNVIVLQPR